MTCTCLNRDWNCPTCSEPITAPAGMSCAAPDNHGHDPSCPVVAPTRLDRFAALIAEYHQSPEDYDAGEEEDPRPYFDGSRELERYALVTVNYSSHGSAKFFFLAFDTRAEAESRGIEFATDDIFEELPVAVVDLDTGKTWEPFVKEEK